HSCSLPAATVPWRPYSPILQSISRRAATTAGCSTNCSPNIPDRSTAGRRCWSWGTGAATACPRAPTGSRNSVAACTASRGSRPNPSGTGRRRPARCPATPNCATRWSSPATARNCSRAPPNSATPCGERRSPRRGPGQQFLESFEALGQAGLHARFRHAVAGLLARVHSMADQLAAAVPEIDEGERLEAHHVREPEEFEGLDDEFVLADGVEDTREAVAAAVVGVFVAVRTAGAEVVLLDLHLHAARAEPLRDEIGILVGAED